MKQTIQERLKQAFIARGAHLIDNARTTKYIVIRTDKHPRSDKEETSFWFLGKSGALRVCRTQTSTKSIPADKTKQFLLENAT